MGKAKKLKISKAPRNTPLEENITKVSAVYGRILVKSSEIYTRVFFDASREWQNWKRNGAKDDLQFTKLKNKSYFISGPTTY